ncbi:cyclic nucleotide-binding protein [Pseudomethylobacillus aquaticus]|uniref:Cyclic nucleotide-binding protein n=1 Tax=Pseudomethylobacillus aquaticus TaxID=2676064 RepID=A0A3N0UV31_9PROT|nr:YhjD/YihY/BrkB family envelope integrity protein [Pseudomethylobacillus aquaticus]ROH84084.1 cyclic nucleotide-binding protein [Pseudomethylobacillus aquaticus]
MPEILRTLQRLIHHPTITRSRDAYASKRYSTPLFILFETLNAFRMHNGFSISASLAFYAMFAMIPLVLLMFFMLSHLIVSSDYAIIKLAILTSNLLPQLSNRIMIEVYNVSSHQAAWGLFGILALLWIVTPLAAALRSAFYTMASMVEVPSFLKRKFKDILAVLGILLLLFAFTAAGLMLEKVLHFLHPNATYFRALNSASSLVLTTLLVAVFYRLFFPAAVALQHILFSALVTACLWVAMQPAFSLFLSINPSYGAVFGGMKTIFISIAWLYYTFAVFLLGTELIATLRRKDVLLLRGLFAGIPNTDRHYLQALLQQYGKTLQAGDYVFRRGDPGGDLYYLISGEVLLESEKRRLVVAGDYFGEMAMLAEAPRLSDAYVQSPQAELIIISESTFETLLLTDPQLAMLFLKGLARRLREQISHHNLAENALT